MLDRAGYPIKVGQIVEVLTSGMLRAVVIEVVESSLVSANGKPTEGTVLLSIAVPMRVRPGDSAFCYIVSDPPADTEQTHLAAGEKPN